TGAAIIAIAISARVNFIGGSSSGPALVGVQLLAVTRRWSFRMRRTLRRAAHDHAEVAAAFGDPPLVQHGRAGGEARRVTVVRRRALAVVVQPVDGHA